MSDNHLSDEERLRRWHIANPGHLYPLDADGRPIMYHTHTHPHNPFNPYGYQHQQGQQHNSIQPAGTPQFHDYQPTYSLPTPIPDYGASPPAAAQTPAPEQNYTATSCSNCHTAHRTCEPGSDGTRRPCARCQSKGWAERCQDWYSASRPVTNYPSNRQPPWNSRANDPEASGPSEQPTYSAAACARCKSRKLGCDKKRPCAKCIAANVDCVDVPSKKQPYLRYGQNRRYGEDAGPPTAQNSLGVAHPLFPVARRQGALASVFA